MKSKSLKKISIFLSCIMLIATFTSCNKNSVTTESNIDVSNLGDYGNLQLPLADKPTKLTFFVESSVSDLPSKFFLKKLKEITNIEIEPILASGANGAQKLQMLAASKQLPDLIRSYLNYKDLESLALNGALVNVSKNLDKMPNIKKLYYDTEENRRAFDEYKSSDGGMYIIPSYGIARKINHLFMYRKDVFDKNNIEPWTDTESFYNALKQLKNKYPDSIPLTSKNQFYFINYMAVQWGMEIELDKYYNKSTNQWEYAGTSDRMKELLDFLRKLYQEKLLDPEFLTNTQASWTAKMTTDNKSFVTFDWVDRMDMFGAQTVSQIPEYNLQPGYPIGTEGKYATMDPIGSLSFLIADNKNSELSMKLADFLMSEAGAKLSTVGIENETFTYDENKKVKYLGFEEGKDVTIKDLEEKYGLFTSGFSMRYHPDCVYFHYTPTTQVAQDLVIEKNLLLNVNPKIVIEGKDAEEYNNTFVDLQKAFEQFASTYIINSPNPDKDWNDWLDKSQSLGSDKFTKLIQENCKNYTR